MLKAVARVGDLDLFYELELFLFSGWTGQEGKMLSYKWSSGALLVAP